MSSVKNSNNGETMKEFAARMDNWRRVVRDTKAPAAACCASWAKWYVALRVSAAAPAMDVLEDRVKPLRPQVAADVLDGWVIEMAWRRLAEFNDKQALKFLYIHQWPEDKIRRQLVGVRGPHVPLVIRRAEKRLQDILCELESVDTIRFTTCLPGCPVPTVELTLP